MEINIKVKRSKENKSEYQDFKVPYTKGMRVLDAIKYIHENIDGTLAYRWNCGMGICGSCAMEVNGAPVLTCKTELKRNLFGTRIAPLKAFPVIKDLVPDYSAVYERERKMNLFFHSNIKNSFLTMSSEETKNARIFKSCIECMICMDSCRPFRDGNQDFLGPKSIVKAVAYDSHPKDTLNRKEILETEGLNACNTTRCCQAACPQDIPITDKGILLERNKKK